MKAPLKVQQALFVVSLAALLVLSQQLLDGLGHQGPVLLLSSSARCRSRSANCCLILTLSWTFDAPLCPWRRLLRSSFGLPLLSRLRLLGAFSRLGAVMVRAPWRPESVRVLRVVSIKLRPECAQALTRVPGGLKIRH